MSAARFLAWSVARREKLEGAIEAARRKEIEGKGGKAASKTGMSRAAERVMTGRELFESGFKFQDEEGGKVLSDISSLRQEEAKADTLVLDDVYAGVEVVDVSQATTAA